VPSIIIRTIFDAFSANTNLRGQRRVAATQFKRALRWLKKAIDRELSQSMPTIRTFFSSLVALASVGLNLMGIWRNETL
jgi:hypothetical protein